MMRTTPMTVASLVLLSASVASAALTTESCIGQKRKLWGKLRQCQAVEDAKAYAGKPSEFLECQTKFDANLVKINAKATSAGIACRYSVQNDGDTVIDFDTGLMWTRWLNQDSSSNPLDVLDADNSYSLTEDPGFVLADGTAVTVFLASLNYCRDDGGPEPPGQVGGKGRHCDWRLPTIAELASLIDITVPGCELGGGFSPEACLDEAAHGPATSGRVASATSAASEPDELWYVAFHNGGVMSHDGKEFGYQFKAVRSAF